MIDASGITQILNIVIGSILVLITGFFVMEFVLAAISLATGFEGSKKVYETAVKQLTGALKGLGLTIVAYFLLNTILRVFGINTATESITTTLGNYFYSLMSCFRNFNNCN